jgi:hypothetical protein
MSLNLKLFRDKSNVPLHAIKAYGVEVELHPFAISVLDAAEW